MVPLTCVDAESADAVEHRGGLTPSSSRAPAGPSLAIPQKDEVGDRIRKAGVLRVSSVANWKKCHPKARLEECPSKLY